MLLFTGKKSDPRYFFGHGCLRVFFSQSLFPMQKEVAVCACADAPEKPSENQKVPDCGPDEVPVLISPEDGIDFSKLPFGWLLFLFIKTVHGTIYPVYVILPILLALVRAEKFFSVLWLFGALSWPASFLQFCGVPAVVRRRCTPHLLSTVSLRWAMANLHAGIQPKSCARFLTKGRAGGKTAVV